MSGLIRSTIKSIRQVVNPGGAQGLSNVTISAVNTAKAVVIMNSNGSTLNSGTPSSARLTSATNVEIVNGAGMSANIYATVIEFN